MDAATMPGARAKERRARVEQDSGDEAISEHRLQPLQVLCVVEPRSGGRLDFDVVSKIVP
ncbi:MAG: hypothetical protein HY692_00260 [Cyanobacteria bacterium NC_groundwater_1444_Ag_S-0.65um_54_12]|nr:hypothetical protein [Cyanobacteria bacterium NC_groundwater_1444_Ag_S-0.65um_54_12]